MKHPRTLPLSTVLTARPPRGFPGPRRALCVVLVLLAALPARAVPPASVHRFQHAASDLRLDEQDGFQQVHLGNAGVHSDRPGAPSLPARFVHLLIPPGTTVTGLTVRATERVVRRGVKVLPIQRTRVLDGRPAPQFVPPDAKHYQSAQPYPPHSARLLGVGQLRGFTIAQVELNPVRYRGQGGEVLLAEDLEIGLELSAVEQPAITPRPAPAEFSDLARALVINPDAVDAQRTALSSSPAGVESVVDYLIITSDTLSNAWQVLADHRASHDGLVCEVRTVASITAAYPGRDAPEKIRNCIIDYVNTRNTRFVLLGGDGESNHTAGTGNPIVPCRYAKARFEDELAPGTWREEEFPCDWYYADTTGNWDRDNDNIFGEASVTNPAEAEGDMLPDVFLARMPARNTVNVNNFVNKLKNFENSPPADAFLRRFLVVANKGFSSFTGEARPTDAVQDGLPGFREHSPVSDCEIWSRRLYRDYAQASGFVPSDYKLFTDTLTSWDGGGGAGSYELNRANLKAKINDGGFYFLFSAAHGYSLGWYMEPENNAFAVSDVKTLTQKAVIVNTIACSTADFDSYEDPSGTYESCISDAFLRLSNHGGLAYIGCAGLSLGLLSDPAGGACFRMAGGFYQAALTHAPASLGQAFSLAKAAYAGQSNVQGDYRYQTFSLILQGDPAMTVAAQPLALRIASSDQTATLAWPSFATDFVLQSSSALGEAVDWTDVTNHPPYVAGDELHCDVPATNEAAFYRLRSSP